MDRQREHFLEDSFTIKKNKINFIIKLKCCQQIFKMAISKVLDFSARSKFTIKLPQAISND